MTYCVLDHQRGSTVGGVFSSHVDASNYVRQQNAVEARALREEVQVNTAMDFSSVEERTLSHMIGMDMGLDDVTGFVVHAPVNQRDMLERLRRTYYFDGTEQEQENRRPPPFRPLPGGRALDYQTSTVLSMQVTRDQNFDVGDRVEVNGDQYHVRSVDHASRTVELIRQAVERQVSATEQRMMTELRVADGLTEQVSALGRAAAAAGLTMNDMAEAVDRLRAAGHEVPNVELSGMDMAGAVLDVNGVTGVDAGAPSILQEPMGIRAISVCDTSGVRADEVYQEAEVNYDRGDGDRRGRAIRVSD